MTVFLELDEKLHVTAARVHGDQHITTVLVQSAWLSTCGPEDDATSVARYHRAPATETRGQLGLPGPVGIHLVDLKDEMGRGGGYILAPCHNIQAVSPPENIVAMYDAGYEYGWS